MIHYGLRPIEYVQSFRKLANMVRSRTSMTAMLWNPNHDHGYPFGINFETNPRAPRRGSENFRLLDTNNDGYIDGRDDPFMAYYPGSEYVDWVGLSLYSYNYEPDAVGNVQAAPSDSRYIAELINGKNRFYSRFSENPGKPMALGESSVAYFHGTDNYPQSYKHAQELFIKQNWWTHLLNIFSYSDRSLMYPNLKLITYFEERKIEDFMNVRLNADKDFRITHRSDIRNHFIHDIDSVSSVKWADELEFTCGGKVVSRSKSSS